MPRIRTYKPDFWSDKRMVRLSPLARLFYMGMWTFSICHSGHLDDDAEELKLKILPADEIDANDLLNELVEAGRVRRCTTANGDPYLWVPTLAEHQNIDPRWKPRCPYCASSPPREPPTTTYEAHRAPESHTRATPSPAPGREGKGRDKNSSSSAPPTTDDDPAFAAFWVAYPRKRDKPRGRRAWVKAIKNGADPGAVLAATQAFAGQCARNRTEPRFIPHPATWLNGERWTDEPEPNGRAGNGIVAFWDA